MLRAMGAGYLAVGCSLTAILLSLLYVPALLIKINAINEQARRFFASCALMVSVIAHFELHITRVVEVLDGLGVTEELE